jgi:molybdenum cofactor synthesis domain-containing protein
MPSAALLVIGNEILSGKVVDTNSPFLAVELRALGVDLERILTIPDEVELIAAEVSQMSAEHDYVFTSGGIGPTHDDLTMEAIALAFDRKLEVNQSMIGRMERAQGSPANESQRKMALIPVDAQVIDAGDLWFPVVIVENVHIFPGIPKLLQKKFHSIRDRFRGVPFQLRRIYVKLFESDIAEHLNALLVEFPELMLGSYPKIGEPEYRVLLTLESRDGDYLRLAEESLLGRLSDHAIYKIE